MEGGSSPDLLTAAIIAGGFVAAVLLLIYAIRRARRARQRQIDEAGEERPIASAKPKDRCYYCKDELLDLAKPLAERLGMHEILLGTNTDDLGDYRPGLQAAKEIGRA